MTDMKMTDQVAGHDSAGREFAGHKNARHEIAGHENAGREIAGQKNIHCESKKKQIDTKLLPIASPNIHLFSKFFHC